MVNGSSDVQVGPSKKLAKSKFSFRGKFWDQTSRPRRGRGNKKLPQGVSRQDNCLKDYITDFYSPNLIRAVIIRLIITSNQLSFATLQIQKLFRTLKCIHSKNWFNENT